MPQHEVMSIPSLAKSGAQAVQTPLQLRDLGISWASGSAVSPDQKNLLEPVVTHLEDVERKHWQDIAPSMPHTNQLRQGLQQGKLGPDYVPATLIAPAEILNAMKIGHHIPTLNRLRPNASTDAINAALRFPAGENAGFGYAPTTRMLDWRDKTNLVQLVDQPNFNPRQIHFWHPMGRQFFWATTGTHHMDLENAVRDSGFTYATSRQITPVDSLPDIHGLMADIDGTLRPTSGHITPDQINARNSLLQHAAGLGFVGIWTRNVASTAQAFVEEVRTQSGITPDVVYHFGNWPHVFNWRQSTDHLGRTVYHPELFPPNVTQKRVAESMENMSLPLKDLNRHVRQVNRILNWAAKHHLLAVLKSPWLASLGDPQLAPHHAQAMYHGNQIPLLEDTPHALICGFATGDSVIHVPRFNTFPMATDLLTTKNS